MLSLRITFNKRQTILDCISLRFAVQTFAERDAELLVDMAQVLEHAKAREGIIAGVSEKLTGELTVLADFLDNVEKRRPKGMRRQRL